MGGSFKITTQISWNEARMQNCVTVTTQVSSRWKTDVHIVTRTKTRETEMHQQRKHMQITFRHRPPCLNVNVFCFRSLTQLVWVIHGPIISPGVRFSKLPKTFRTRKHFGALFGCFSRVPKSVSQNTRKCPEMSTDFFRESFRVTGYDNGTRAGKIILERGFIITTLNFSS